MGVVLLGKPFPTTQERPVTGEQQPISQPQRIDRYVGQYAERAVGMVASEIRALFAVAARPEIVSLAGGAPLRKRASVSQPRSSRRCSRKPAASPRWRGPSSPSTARSARGNRGPSYGLPTRISACLVEGARPGSSSHSRSRPLLRSSSSTPRSPAAARPRSGRVSCQATAAAFR